VKKLKRDPEFQSLIPAMLDEEYKLLEKSIIKEGVRNAIVTWHGYIVDGHHRYKICEEHGIEFETIELEIDERHKVINWIISNQLGRRNLLPEQKQYLIHKMYENEKHAPHRPKNDAKGAPLKTDVKIAKRIQVSERTIHNAHKFGKALDMLNSSGLDKNKILSGEIKASQKSVIKLASFKPEDRDKVIKKLEEPRANIKTVIKELGLQEDGDIVQESPYRGNVTFNMVT
jgi:hypothetical protein